MLLRTKVVQVQSGSRDSPTCYVCYIELWMKNNNAKVTPIHLTLQVGLGMKFAFSSVVVDNT